MPNIKRLEKSALHKSGYFVEIERRFKNQRIVCACKFFPDEDYANIFDSKYFADLYQKKSIKEFPRFCFRRKTIEEILNEWKLRTGKLIITFPVKILEHLLAIDHSQKFNKVVVGGVKMDIPVLGPISKKGLKYSLVRTSQKEIMKDWITERITK